jgi:peptidoglycan/xylan/chitin deacetylase (PgdA/CDA1 family)
MMLRLSGFRSLPVLAGLLGAALAAVLSADTASAEEAAPAGAAAVAMAPRSALPPGEITAVAPAAAANALAAGAASAGTAPAGAGAAAPSAGIYANWIGKRFQRGTAAGKMIALTFDDGPNPRTTPRVVEALKQAGATATFFWIGDMVAKNPSTAMLVKNAGFEFGSHSWSHKNLRALSADGARQEIISAQDVIEKTTGVRPHLFRPPYGNINVNVNKITQDDNLVMVMWAVDSDDWQAKMTQDKVFERITTEVHPGAIILMHDIQEKTVQVLPRLLADLKAKGYQFVTVSQLIAETNKAPQPAAGAGADAPSMGGGTYGATDAPAPAQPLVIPLDQTK